jgi:hypothetical protein
MYAGHLGFALGASSVRRSIPLWLLLLAAELPDWMDVGVCSIDMDRGPFGLYTHGIPIVTALALTLAVVYALAKQDWFGGFVVAVVVASHYGLDLLTGIKPTWAGGPIIGLGLYDRAAAELTLEVVTILLGWFFYRRTFPEEQRRAWPMYAILVALLAFQAVGALAFYLNVGGQMKC